MHADVPTGAQCLQVSSDLRRRIDPVGGVNHIRDSGLGRVASGCTVEQDVAADLFVRVVVHHQNCQVWNVGKLADLFVDRGDPSIVRQEASDQLFSDPVGTMWRMLVLVHSQGLDFSERLARDAGDARKGAIEVAALLDAGKRGLEAVGGRRYGGGYAGHGSNAC